MQYKVGTCSLTNSSNIVTGSGTLWLANVSVGDTFKRKGEDAIYTIGAVNSDTQITLTANYAGTTGSGLEYQITRDFTTNLGLAEISAGDIDWPYHLTQETIRKIDEKMGQVLNPSASPTHAGLTLSGLTAGSIPFAGTGGLISQDNANLFWDNTNKRAGIGTTIPHKREHIVVGVSAGNLVYALKLEHPDASETTNSATGILFNVGDVAIAERGKGGLIYNLPSGANWGRGDFHFLQNTASATTNAGLSDSVMVIKNNGNVGIGTSLPTSALQVVGLPIYANNAAAVAGGLTAGAFYRTGADPDPVCVVH